MKDALSDMKRHVVSHIAIFQVHRQQSFDSKASFQSIQFSKEQSIKQPMQVEKGGTRSARHSIFKKQKNETL
jgi:hypothetical protein